MWTVEFGKLPIYVKRKHDKIFCKKERTVYSVIRPMAILAKILGTFPLDGILSCSAEKLKFYVVSCGTIWGLILFSGIIFLLAWTSASLFTYSQQNSAHFWKVSYCILVMTRSILQFLFCNVGARNIPELLRILDKSYICRQADCVTKPWKMMPFVVFIAQISVIVYLDYVFFGSLLPPDKNNLLTGSLFSLLRIWQIVPCLLYFQICKIILSGFKLIEERVNNHLWALEPFYRMEKGNREEVRKMTEKIEWFRLEHALLNKATEALSKSYGFVLLVDYTAMTVILVVQLYVIVIFEIDPQFIFCALTNFMTGTGAIHISHALTKSSEAPLDSLLSIPMYNLQADIRYQIRLFQNQVSCLQTKVSAGGFFKLDRKRIVAMMGTVATYFIILIEYGDFITQQAGVQPSDDD